MPENPAPTITTSTERFSVIDASKGVLAANNPPALTPARRRSGRAPREVRQHLATPAGPGSRSRGVPGDLSHNIGCILSPGQRFQPVKPQVKIVFPARRPPPRPAGVGPMQTRHEAV
ncbi:hypothetical protein Asp14428_18890 [Actinoplanes sp. NBRC 14428]|nr:hypothetical protein Asp14428_18890 [Actinoplanes sp. NBRC 14428]